MDGDRNIKKRRNLFQSGITMPMSFVKGKKVGGNLEGCANTHMRNGTLMVSKHREQKILNLTNHSQ